MEFLRGERVFTAMRCVCQLLPGILSRRKHLAAALRTPVDIVNQVLTFLVTIGILLGLWMCLSARQGGFAL